MEAWKTEGCVPDSDDEDADLALLDSFPRDQQPAWPSKDGGVGADESEDELTLPGPVRNERNSVPSFERASKPTSSQTKPVKIEESSGTQPLYDARESNEVGQSPSGVSQLATTDKPETSIRTGRSVDAPLEDQNAQHHEELFATEPGASPPDSPLSSISSASADWKDFELQPLRQPTVFQNGVKSVAIPMDSIEDVATLSRIYGGMRSLRQRNPIQLHPYMLEAERYKRTMHSRGVKAVRIEQESQSQGNEVVGSDHEDENLDFLPSSPSSSTKSLNETQDTHIQPPASSSVPGDELELPSIEDLLKPQRRLLKRPRKRRRVQLDFTARTEASEKTRSGATQHDNEGHSLPTPRRSDDIESPRSTPLVIVPPARFRPPPVLHDLQLQTPIKSPRLHSQERRSSSSLSSSPGSPGVVPISVQRRHRAITVEELSDSGSDLPHRHSNERHATLLQKRMKGVLPASWTTLNLPKAQAQQGETKRAHVLSNQQRGVAKPLKSRSLRQTTVSSNGAQDIQVFSDSEDQEDKEPQSTKPTQLSAGQSLPTQISLDWPDSDEMEDDTIDLMLDKGPSRRNITKQKQAFPTTRRLKQTKLVGQSSKRKRSDRSVTYGESRSLGILDINDDTRNLPDFLRVAANTAKKRPDKGRTSPSRKVFHLHDQNDNQELRATLEKWRKPVLDANDNSPTSKQRIPLELLTGNEQRRVQNHPHNSSKPNRTRLPNDSKRGKRLLSSSRQQRLTFGQGNPLDQVLNYAAAKAEVIRSIESRRADKEHKTPPAGMRGSNKTTRLYPTGPAQLSTPSTSHERQALKFASTHTLHGPSLPMQVLSSHRTDHFDAQAELSVLDSPSLTSRIPRKRPPRRRDIQRPFIDDKSDLDEMHGEPMPFEPTGGQQPLDGLQNGKAVFSLSFEIEPLPTGSHFSRDTFLGSGRFASYLSVTSDLIEQSESLNASSALTERWSTWNESVREELSKVIANAQREVISNGQAEAVIPSGGVGNLESVADYVCHRLSFADQVDRVQFLQDCGHMAQEFVYCIRETRDLQGVKERRTKAQLVLSTQLMSRLALFMHQLQCISMHDIVPREVKQLCQDTLKLVIREATESLLGFGMGHVQKFLRTRDDLGLGSLNSGDTSVSIAESFVIIIWVARLHSTQIGSLWSLFDDSNVLSIKSVQTDPIRASIEDLEQRWHILYSILPLIDLDKRGIKNFSSSMERDSHNWIFVKRLVKPILDGYQLGLTSRLPAFNLYCRTIFRRCFDLIKRWTWRGCDSIVGFLFDFFARNRLSNLKHELAYGSPDFLQHLSDDLELDQENRDTCFQVLLKIIGLGIKTMRETAPEKKVRDLIWRLIPNHDRKHPKDQEIKQEDLDATRNHHDLLCTLFWAAPVAQRPNLKLIRGLVQDEGSHRQAYHINIQSWSNLVHYQIKSDSDRPSLEPFQIWANDLINRLLNQHSLARTEIEEQALQVAESQSISSDIQERAIDANQKQIEAILQHLLVSIWTAISICPSLESASALISPSLTRLLQMHDFKRARFDKAVVAVLSIVDTAVQIHAEDQSRVSGPVDEDSQGFDWAGFGELDENVNAQEPSAISPILSPELYDALHSLLLACMNSNWTRSEELMVKLVQTWAATANAYVRTNIKTWENYLGPYGHDTWAVIGDSANKRRLSPLFMSLLLRSNPELYQTETQVILSLWIESLVERESQLKYQGQLTSCILQVAINEPLLDNLPFVMNRTGQSEITLEAISQRRIVLLTSVFSNMRKAISVERCPNALTRNERLSDYQQILRHMMSSMRRRYEEIGGEYEGQSTYVAFVHAIIRGLSEYTSEICPLDPFFTTSAAFPLPADDPSYVVSKLKGYGLRLSDHGVPKQLTMFVTATIERAVHDDQQSAVVEHLSKTSSSITDGATNLALRSFLLQSLVPPYIEATLESGCGWLLLLPVLQSAKNILENLSEDINTCDERDVDTAIHSISIVLTRLLPLAANLNKGLFASTGVFELLITILFVMKSALPLTDYLLQLGSIGPKSSIARQVMDIIRLSQSLRQALNSSAETWPDFSPSEQWESQVRDQDLYNFTVREVRESLKRLKFEGGQYFAKRNATWKLVQIPPSSQGNQGNQGNQVPMRTRLEEALDELDADIERLPYICKIGEWVALSSSAMARNRNRNRNRNGNENEVTMA